MIHCSSLQSVFHSGLRSVDGTHGPLWFRDYHIAFSCHSPSDSSWLGQCPRLPWFRMACPDSFEVHWSGVLWNVPQLRCYLFEQGVIYINEIYPFQWTVLWALINTCNYVITTTTRSRTFSITPKFPRAFARPRCLRTTDLFPIPVALPFLECHGDGIMQCVSSWVWLLLL